MLVRIKTLVEDLPLRPVIGVALIIGLALPASLVVWQGLGQQRQTLFDTLAKDHVRIVETLANGMQTPLWDVRPETGTPMIEVIMADSRVTAVSVTSPVLPTPLQAGTPGAGGRDTVALERPVVREGKEIGLVRVEMTTAPLRAEAARQGSQALLIAAFQTALGLVLVFALIRFKVLAPLRRLVQESEQLAAGRLDRPFAWERKDELGSLGRSFEDTRVSLQQLFRDLEQRNAELLGRENELHQRTRVLRATLDNMTDGITLIDSDLRILAWNDRFVEMFELPAQEVYEGKPILDLHRTWLRLAGFPERQRETLVARTQVGFDAGQPVSTQVEAPSGSIFLLRRRPLADGGFVSTYTDVTEQVRARRKADDTLQLLDSVIDAVPAILHVKDRDLRYEFVNRYFLEFFDLSRERILGRRISEVLKPEWLSGFQDHGPEVLASGRPSPFYEIALRRPTGEKVDLLGTKVPLLDDAGTVTHVVTVEIDITERKRIQQALSHSEELYRLVVDLSPYGIVLHDANGILFMNPAGCRILGASRAEQVVGRNYLEFVSDGDRSQVEERLMRILDRNESLAQTERRLIRMDRREIVVATSGVPFQRGEEHLALVIFVDITDMKRAEQELARHHEALHQAEKISALGSLLAGVAHELNNPLAVVVGRATLLEQVDLPPSVAASVANIKSAADRCAGIVRTFLAMARQQAPTRSLVDVEALIDASVELLLYGLDAGGIEVVKETAHDLPATMADPDQLSQVFNNIIINARQAMDGWEGQRRLTIRTEFDRSQDAIRVVVSDSGPGIPEEMLGRVFDPFFTTKPVGTGTGMGLAVCRGFVESHGGTLRLQQADGGGAAFVVTLPVIRTGGTQPETQEEEIAPAAGHRHVLVVDDEEGIRNLLVDILAVEGHTVREARDGREALACLDRERFDLIISDLVMPSLDGPGLFQALSREHPEMARRMVFVTGDTLSASARDFLARAAQPTIEKPFLPDDVRTAMLEIGHADLAPDRGSA